MKKFYYLYIAAYSLIPANMNSIPIMSVPPVQLYVGDVLTAIAVVMCASALLKWKGDAFGMVEIPYFLFLLWLIVEIVLGTARYGYRAFGESRTIMQFFIFFLPYALFSRKEEITQQQVTNLVRTTIALSGILALLALVVGPFWGNAENDFRGDRYLNSNQTFFLMLLGVSLLFLGLNKKGGRRGGQILAVLLFIGAILSKNRTALVSMGGVTLGYMLLSGRLRMLVVLLLSVLIVTGAFAYFFPSAASEVALSLEGIRNPTEDENYTWRLMVQGAALEQGMETFWVGQGYGSYFTYEIDEGGQAGGEVAPPHNQFLSMFLKSGIVGVLLLVGAMLWLLFQGYRALMNGSGSKKTKKVLVVLLLATASQFLYGFGYDFHVLFGVYFGLSSLLIKTITVQKEQSNLASDGLDLES